MITNKYFPLVVTSLLFALMFIFGSWRFENFGSLPVFLNLFTDNAFLIITAVGMTFVILSGGIDLSVGATIALSGVVISVLVGQYQWHPLYAFACVLVGGTLFGAAMGCIIYFYKLQPFVVTLAGMFLMRGLASIVSEESRPITHEFYDRVALFGIEMPQGAWLDLATIVSIVVLLLAIILAHYTRFGARVYALGGNVQSAALMGVPVAQTTIAIYALSSCLASLSGIIFSFYTFSGYSLAALGVELDAIAAVVIGGTLLTGGYGFVLGTLFGVLIMSLVQTYISFDGQLSSWWTKIVVGILLFVFIAMQRLLAFKRNIGVA